MRTIPILISILMMGAPALAAATDDPTSIRPFWVDTVDSADGWSVVEGAGTLGLVEDAARSAVRVEAAGAGVTRAVGPSMPTELPVQIGVILRAPSAFGPGEAEVRFVDVSGGTLARLQPLGNEWMLVDADGARQHVGTIALPRPIEIRLTATDVQVPKIGGTVASHAALSAEAFDHIELRVADRYLEIDHVTGIPEGSGFLDFFHRATIDSPHVPWTFQGDADTAAGGVLGTEATARLPRDASISFEDARLGAHRHEMHLHFRTNSLALTPGVPLLYGIDAAGEPTWAVELRYARTFTSNLGIEALRSVVFRDAGGGEREVMPLTPYDVGAWSQLQVTTDPALATVSIVVDGAALDVSGVDLTELRGLGIGDGFGSPASLVPRSIDVDGVVAGFRAGASA